jgi:hypothetical protein
MQCSCADVNSPYKRKCWTNSGGPLINSLLWDPHPIRIHNTVQCTVYSAQCTLYGVRCIVYTVHGWPYKRKRPDGGNALCGLYIAHTGPVINKHFSLPSLGGTVLYHCRHKYSFLGMAVLPLLFYSMKKQAEKRRHLFLCSLHLPGIELHEQIRTIHPTCFNFCCYKREKTVYRFEICPYPSTDPNS